MRKLLLVPVALVTAMLVVAFVTPNSTASVMRAITPHFAINLGSLSNSSGSVDEGSTVQLTQVGSSTSSVRAANQTGSAVSGSGTITSATTPLGTSLVDVEALFALIPGSDPHSVATVARENCGRFGNGFHGGKHLFVCPNRPFPPPAH